MKELKDLFDNLPIVVFIIEYKNNKHYIESEKIIDRIYGLSKNEQKRIYNQISSLQSDKVIAYLESMAKKMIFSKGGILRW